jgi:hypothetical protein
MIYDLRFKTLKGPERGLQPASTLRLQATLKRHKRRAAQTKKTAHFSIGRCALRPAQIANRKS